MRHRLFAVALALVLPGAASAVTVDGSWWLAGDALAGSGLEVRVSRRAGDFGFELADGAERRLRLFRIWTDEGDVGADDRTAASLVAGFDLPALGRGGSVAGEVRGREAFPFEWGTVDWRAPLEIEVARRHAVGPALRQGLRSRRARAVARPAQRRRRLRQLRLRRRDGLDGAAAGRPAAAAGRARPARPAGAPAPGRRVATARRPRRGDGSRGCRRRGRRRAPSAAARRARAPGRRRRRLRPGRGR